MSEMGMVEKVAKAIYKADDPWYSAFPWPNLNEKRGRADDYRRVARAAIEAMREPTEAMIEAVEGVSVGGPYLGPLDADDIYGQMIDAALSEVEG